MSRKHSGPIQTIKHKLSERSGVLVTPVDEFRTSKLDSNTWTGLVNMKAKTTVTRLRDGNRRVVHNQKIHTVQLLSGV